MITKEAYGHGCWMVTAVGAHYTFIHHVIGPEAEADQVMGILSDTFNLLYQRLGELHKTIRGDTTE